MLTKILLLIILFNSKIDSFLRMTSKNELQVSQLCRSTKPSIVKIFTEILLQGEVNYDESSWNNLKKKNDHWKLKVMEFDVEVESWPFQTFFCPLKSQNEPSVSHFEVVIFKTGKFALIFFSFIKLIVNIFIRTYKLNLLKSERYETNECFLLCSNFPWTIQIKKK
jgi:hypothetical protein